MTAAASYFFHGRTAFPTAVYDPLLTCFNTREYENALQTSGLVRCSQLAHCMMHAATDA